MRFSGADFTISRKRLLAVTILVSSTLAWFFVFYYNFEDIFAVFTKDSFLVYAGNALFLISIAISAIIGSMISERTNRRKFLLLWIVSGVLATASIAFFQGTISLIFVNIILGISFGVGLPSSWAVLADYTAVEERGRVSGVVILVTFGSVVLAFIGISSMGLGLLGIILLCIAIKLTGLVALALDPFEREKIKAKSWRAVLGYRDFILFLLAYILFNAANGLVSFVWAGLPSTADYEWAFSSGTALHYIGTGVFALISGFLADRFGRKKPIILGLVLLGIGYALVGLFTSAISVFIHMIISGFAWGIIMVIYLAIPGDLSVSGSRERFYALGAIVPFMLFSGFGSVSWFLRVSPPVAIFSSTLSMVLFVSILPILYASEPLPEAKLSARRIKEHVEKVGKLVEESKKIK